MNAPMSATSLPDISPTSTPHAGAGARKSKRPQGQLARLLFSDDPIRAEALKLCLLAASVYLAWFILLPTLAVPQGLLTQELATVFMVHEAISILLFYPLVRSGLTRHLRDPALVVPQIVWASLAVVLFYVLTPASRAISLQTLSLILVFGFMSLSARAAIWTGGFMVLMLLGLLLISVVLPLPQFEIRQQTLTLVTTSFILAMLTAQSYQFAKMRKHVSRERKKLNAALEQVQSLMRHDTMTGLYNRQGMQERLDMEVKRCTDSGHSFSVAMVDLDHFKFVNDAHGHAVGDEVLQSFARCSRQVLRDTDLIARWGGEEFVILMLDTSPADMASIALTRLRQVLQGMQVSQPVPDLRITFSAGYAMWQPGEDIDHLMSRADQALYQAKHDGRDQFKLAETSVSPTNPSAAGDKTRAP
jgi:diguanylate cyclase (GGDEF)-like protein